MLAQQRLAQAGLHWPTAWHPARWPRSYAATLVGRLDAAGAPATFEVLLREPPRDTVQAQNLHTFDAVSVSFGVSSKRAFADANPDTQVPATQAAVQLDARGLFFASLTGAQAVLPQERLADIPLTAMLSVIHAHVTKQHMLTRAGTDHIVDKYAPVAQFGHFSVSRWRGEPFFRLTHAHVRVEVEVQAVT